MAESTGNNAQELPDPERADLEAAEAADAAAAPGAPDQPEGPPHWVTEPGVSTLAPRWWIKTLAFAVVLIGFGAWGLYDALVAYPERGIKDAEHKQLEYLRVWATSGRLTEATVADPVAELARLQELSRQPSMMSQADPVRLVWLQSLVKVARLKPEFTRIENPMERLRELESSWISKTPPKALSAYDIPAQWLFVLIGFAVGPWLLVKYFRVAAKKYHWDPVGQKLTIPGGQVVAPGDLEDVDKRRWDKFIVFLKIKDTHPALAGQEVKMDLYHYTQPVEDWVVAMEQTAFPERAEDEGEPDSEDSAEASDAEPRA